MKDVQWWHTKVVVLPLTFLAISSLSWASDACSLSLSWSSNLCSNSSWVTTLQCRKKMVWQNLVLRSSNQWVCFCVCNTTGTYFFFSSPSLLASDKCSGCRLWIWDCRYSALTNSRWHTGHCGTSNNKTEAEEEWGKDKTRLDKDTAEYQTIRQRQKITHINKSASPQRTHYNMEADPNQSSTLD